MSWHGCMQIWMCYFCMTSCFELLFWSSKHLSFLFILPMVILNCLLTLLKDPELHFCFSLKRKVSNVFIPAYLNNSDLILHIAAELEVWMPQRLKCTLSNKTVSWQNVLPVGVLIFTAHFKVKKKNTSNSKNPKLSSFSQSSDPSGLCLTWLIIFGLIVIFIVNVHLLSIHFLASFPL